MVKGQLEIFIITYNRSSLLKETLIALLASPFSGCNITIMNNCSTDDTVNIYETFKNKFKSINCITHYSNIGAGPNILRSIEMSTCDYCWVLCDDDHFDFSQIEDVVEILKKGEAELILVGGHNESYRHGGTFATPSKLIAFGYPYFKYSSFIPANIIKVSAFKQNSLISGYNNVVNGYPHMPFMQYLFSSDIPVYISKSRIVTAGSGNRFYKSTTWFMWWMNTADHFKCKKDRKLFFMNHFPDGLGRKENILIARAAMTGNRNYLEIKSFLIRTLPFHVIMLHLFIFYNYLNDIASRIRVGKLWGVCLYYKNKLKGL